MECKKEINLANCPCSHPDCPRKGRCCECVEHHRRKGEVVACLFPAEGEAESVEDRSVKKFIEAWDKYGKEVDAAKNDILTN